MSPRLVARQQASHPYEPASPSPVLIATRHLGRQIALPASPASDGAETSIAVDRRGAHDLIDTPDVRRPTRDGFVLGPVLEKQGTATLRTISLPSGENLVGERRT